MKDRKGKGLYKLIGAGIWVVLIVLGLAIPLTVSAGAGESSLTGSISGNVFMSDGITPVEGAVIFVNDFQTGTTAGSAASDPSGAYVVSDLPAGDYRLLANATVQGLPVQYYNGTEDAEDATPVAVSEGAETSTINFTLGVGATISGTVYEADGLTPLGDADVWADSYECCGGGEGTRTAPGGTFTITGLAPGDYRVVAQGEGYAREFYEETSDFDLANRVTATAGTDTSGIDFTLVIGAAISGIVYEADGITPLGDADVWADSYECCGGGEGTRTAPGGTFTITGLAPGDYRVAASAEGYTRETTPPIGAWLPGARRCHG